MRKTSNIELSLYDPTDTFDITGSSNSLNHNMEIIDQKFSDTPNSSDIKKVSKDIASLKTETNSLKTETNSLKEDLSNKITKFYASSQGETHLADSDDGNIMDMILYGKSSQDGTPSPENPVEIKSVVNPTVKLSNEDGTQFKTLTLPYTLNAIPVNSGGNVTIDGQQYIADYVDVKRGKLVRMVLPVTVLDSGYGSGWSNSHQVLINRYMKNTTNDKIGIILCDKLRPASANDVWNGIADNIVSVHNTESNRITFRCTAKANDMDSALKFIKSCKIYIALAESEEIGLTPEEIAAFKTLVTYYPTTNISINSEQLDGYTVFNYPFSMKNGWDYVKKQLNDNRDYIYNMDTKTQDIDTQAAEAYVNSEYAVALTELEV